MLTSGQKFRVVWEILGITEGEERTHAVFIPVGAMLRVSRFPSEADVRLAEVVWGDRKRGRA
jgi:hypothetical protein